MLDKFNREINYLRISVTDRCNLRCTYCMPEEGISLINHKDILTFEEIYEVTKEAVNLGVTKVRLTGGEPLVRHGIIDLVAMIGKINGIKDFAMTTNGALLEKYAGQLKEAGLQRVNISLDTIDPERYHNLTRTGNIDDVFRGIEAAKKAGLTPIKINTVIEKSPDEQDARQVAEYVKKNNLQIRYIRKMDLRKGEFWQVVGGEGGNCSTCNRLRLSSSGDLKPCLFSDLGFNIKELGIKEALLQAIGKKPESGHVSTTTTFYGLGG
ncbi:MAG: radical SAM protein [Calditrichia bacterium]|nr:radical SAM protein [Calditrichia bacterium]